jgi:hypothetical protein
MPDVDAALMKTYLLRDGYVGWHGLGGSAFQWHPGRRRNTKGFTNFAIIQIILFVRLGEGKFLRRGEMVGIFGK